MSIQKSKLQIGNTEAIIHFYCVTKNVNLDKNSSLAIFLFIGLINNHEPNLLRQIIYYINPIEIIVKINSYYEPNLIVRKPLQILLNKDLKVESFYRIAFCKLSNIKYYLDNIHHFIRVNSKMLIANIGEIKRKITDKSLNNVEVVDYIVLTIINSLKLYYEQIGRDFLHEVLREIITKYEINKGYPERYEEVDYEYLKNCIIECFSNVIENPLEYNKIPSREGFIRCMRCGIFGKRGKFKDRGLGSELDLNSSTFGPICYKCYN